MPWRVGAIELRTDKRENRLQRFIAMRNTNAHTCARRRAQRSGVCPGNRWIPSIVEAVRVVQVGSRPSSGTRALPVLVERVASLRLRRPGLFVFAREVARRHCIFLSRDEIRRGVDLWPKEFARWNAFLA